MPKLSYYDEICNVIEDAGWIIAENGYENNYMIYTHRDRNEYRLIFSNWDNLVDGNEPPCCITIDEFERPQAVYFHQDFEVGQNPAETLNEALADFRRYYL